MEARGPLARDITKRLRGGDFRQAVKAVSTHRPSRPQGAGGSDRAHSAPKLLGREHEKAGREPRPVRIGSYLEKNRRSRGLARENPQQNAQAHQGSRPGPRPGEEGEGESG